MSISVNNDIVTKVEEFLRQYREHVRSYSKRLPEVQCAENLLNKGFPLEDIVKYIVFVSVNDWNLTGLRGGAKTLWEVSMHEFIKRHESFEKLAQEVVKQLTGLKNDRKKQIINVGKGLDKLSSDLYALINEIMYCNKINMYKIREFVSRLRNALNIKIPIDKSSNLIGRILHFITGKEVDGETSIMYDVHVAKVSIRLGIVTISVDNMDVVALSLFNNTLRKTIVNEWNQIAKNVDMTPWHIDAFLWFIGRENCVFDDEVGYLSTSEPSCPARRRGKECVLNTICKAAKDHVNVALFSSKIAGSEIVVVYRIVKQ